MTTFDVFDYQSDEIKFSFLTYNLYYSTFSVRVMVLIVKNSSLNLSLFAGCETVNVALEFFFLCMPHILFLNLELHFVVGLKQKWKKCWHNGHNDIVLNASADKLWISAVVVMDLCAEVGFASSENMDLKRNTCFSSE